MLYTIISKEPFIYLFNESDEILKSDYDYVVENPEECEIPSDFVPVEYKVLSPSEFSKILDNEIKEGFVYTFVDGHLIKRLYKKAPYFYVNPEYGMEYPTYCSNPNSIKAGLLTNEVLKDVIESITQDYYSTSKPKISLDIPLMGTCCSDDYNVLAYVCVPVVMKPIPIGIETEEEHQEILEDEESFSVE